MADPDLEGLGGEAEAPGMEIEEGEEGEEEEEDDDDELDEDDREKAEDALPWAAAAAAAAAAAKANTLDNKMRLYGAIQESVLLNTGERNMALKRRRRMNCVPIMLSLFLPWALFLIVFGVVSFEAHYSNPNFTSLCCLCSFASSLIYLNKIWKRWFGGDEDEFYKLYLAMTFVAAIAIGWILGDLNFWTHMQPVYNLNKLATYTNIDPSVQVMPSGDSAPTSGKRFQDAGRVYFNHEAVVDTTKSMSFKLGHLYCVAPIVNPNCQYNCGHDFWAVGVDCCSEDSSNFRCGDFNNPRAKSGLRYMIDAYRPYFRLAVLQAEGAHNIMSAHPVFVEWLADPSQEVRHTELNGYRVFMLAMIGSFIVNALGLMCVLKWAQQNIAA